MTQPLGSRTPPGTAGGTGRTRRIFRGGRLSPASLAGTADLADRPTPLMHLAYAGRMPVDLLVAAIGACHFAKRSAGAARRAA